MGLEQDKRTDSSSLFELEEGLNATADSFTPDSGRKAYLVLLGAFIGLAGSMGLVNSNGTIENYVSDTILPNTPQDKIGWIFSCFNFFCFGSSIFVGPIFDLQGYKLCMGIGICLFVTGHICFSESTKYYQLLMSYILSGIGLSFLFVSNIGSISHYFYRKRAAAMGIGFTGGAVGGIVYPIVLRSLLPKLGFAWSMKVITLIVLTCFVISFILSDDRSQELKEKTEEKEQHMAKRVYSATIGKVSISAFKNRVFSLLVVAMMGSSFPFQITLNYIVSYGVANGISAKNAYMLIMVMNATSIVGRLSGGFIADKFGRLNTLCIVNSLTLLTYLILWLPPPVGHHIGGLFTFCVVFGLVSGSNISLGPACVGQISETSEFASRYGSASSCLSLINLFGIPIGGAIIGVGKTVSGFDHLVIFITCISIIGTICSWLCRYFFAGTALTVV